MAKTNTKPGPKPGPKRREYHFRLSVEKEPGNTLSLADVFDKLSERYGGDQKYIEYLLRQQVEVQRLQREG